jgi:hypothetical protein
MERRDLVKDELERIGKAISQLLANFLALKANGNITLAIENTNKQFKDELDIDIDIMLGFSQQELTHYLNEKKLSPPQLETIIEYFIEIGNHSLELDRKKGESILIKALEMYKVLDANSTTYSFQRREKEQKIKQLLHFN